MAFQLFQNLISLRMHTENETGIPLQKGGASSDTDATATLGSADDAKDFYNVVKQRLQLVSHWQEWAGAATAHFQLTDGEGKAVDRAAQEGDYFKIDIPGPGPASGDGFDWVRVETINETTSHNKEQISIQVRPVSSPGNDKKDVAHFFSGESSSCFMVTRDENKVTAGVHGRNEKPNTDTETLADKARNVAIATGAVAAFSKMQWKSLVNGLIKKEA